MNTEEWECLCLKKISESATSREKLIELLRAGKVSEFNALRAREGLEEIDLRGADFSRVDFSRADLFEVKLIKANLRGANLSWANLHGADLGIGIILINAPYYQEATVSEANFEDALINDRGFLEYLRENGEKTSLMWFLLRTNL